MNETSAFVIRELHPDDSIPAITALLHEAYAPLSAMGLRFMATHQDDSVTADRLHRGLAYVATLDGVIVGTITLYAPGGQTYACEWYGRPAVFRFGQFAVRPDLQRQGLGLRLMQTIEQRAFAGGGTELALDTAEDATHLRRWYEAIGYRFIQFMSWEDTNYRSVILSKHLRN